MKRITGIGAGIVAIAGLGFVLYGAWTKVQPVTTTQASVAATDTAKAQADAEAAAKAKAEAEAKAKAAAEAAAKIQKESEQIEALAKSLATTYAGHVAMSVIDLDNGAWGGVDMDTPIVSASVYKIFVAYGIYQQIDQGKLTKQSTVKAVGKTVDACLAAMIEVSDNDCGKALGDIAGWQKLDSQLHAMGFNATILNNYTGSGVLSGDKQTSPSDVARFMQRLYHGALLSKQSTDDFIAILKADKLNTWLPSGLPSGTVIAHKTGALYNYVHDAGIVYAPKGTYIIVVMTKGWANATSQPPAVFADISKQFWDYFNS